MKNGLEFADFLALMSLYLGIKNLTENEQQSDQQIKILQQIDVGAANDRQAAYLLEEISRQVVRFIKDSKAAGEVPPAGMLDVWNYEHNRHIESISKIKMLLEMFKK